MSTQVSTDPGVTFKGAIPNVTTENVILIGSNIYENKNAPYITPARQQSWTVPPYSGISNGTSQAFSGQQIIFRIAQGTIPGRITHLDLEMILAETGRTNSVTPPILPFCFQQIVVSLNGTQSRTDQIVYPLQLLKNYLSWSDEKVANKNGGQMNLLNMNPITYGNPTAIAPGGQGNYVQDLDALMITDMWTELNRVDTYIVFYMPSSSPAVAGSGTLQINSMNLRVYNEINGKADPISKGLIDSKPYFINLLHNQMYTSANQTLTASTLASPIPMSGLAGILCDSITIVINPTGGTAANQTTFQALGGTYGDSSALTSGSIDMKVSAGTSILGGAPLPSYYARSYTADYVNNAGRLSSALAIYTIWFGHNPMFYKDGNNTGGYTPQTTDNLWLTPGAGFPTGTYNVVMIAAGTKRFFKEPKGAYEAA